MNKDSIKPAHDWFDYDTAARYLGISQRALARLVSGGKIGYTRLGRQTLWDQKQLDDYIVSCTVQPRL